jgi:hypothetical protein
MAYRSYVISELSLAVTNVYIFIHLFIQGVVREHQLLKKSPTPPFLSKEEQRKKEKNESLDIEQI